jgi:hypothetical protein
MVVLSQQIPVFPVELIREILQYLKPPILSPMVTIDAIWFNKTVYIPNWWSRTGQVDGRYAYVSDLCIFCHQRISIDIDNVRRVHFDVESCHVEGSGPS